MNDKFEKEHEEGKLSKKCPGGELPYEIDGDARRLA